MSPVDLLVLLLVDGLVLTDVVTVGLRLGRLNNLDNDLLLGEKNISNLLKIERFLLFFLPFRLIHLDRVVQDGLHSEAVHPADVWLDTFLVGSSHKVTVKGLLHQETKKIFSEYFLSNFHQLKGKC